MSIVDRWGVVRISSLLQGLYVRRLRIFSPYVTNHTFQLNQLIVKTASSQQDHMQVFNCMLNCLDSLEVWPVIPICDQSF